jgi:hypothetical protein
LDAITAVLLRQSPAAALVGLVVLGVIAVYRGWLVPRPQVQALEAATRRVEEIEEQRLKESRERELDWRKAWEVSEAARAITAASTADMLEAMRTLEALVRATPAGAPAKR